MNCYNCHKEIVEGARYCQHCGAAQKPFTPPPPPPKTLRRSRKHKMIAGVCAGFAEYFELEISLVRVLWLLVALAGGGGFLAYLICWLVIPFKEEEVATPVPVSQ